MSDTELKIKIILTFYLTIPTLSLLLVYLTIWSFSEL